MVCWTLGEVRDGSEDPRKHPGRVRGPTGMSCTGRGTLGDVLDVPGDLQRGPKQFVGLSRRSRTGRGTSGRSGLFVQPLGRFGTFRWIIEEGQDGSGTLEEVWDGARNTRGGPGRVGRPTGRSGTVWGTLEEVRDGSGDR